MASNLKQKNTIFSEQIFDKIPFGNVNKLNVYSEKDSMNNAVIMNNTYNQMIQNDNFVKNEIIVKSGETIGPKSGDDVSIYDGPNGYKFYHMENGDPYIYQKIDVPTKDSFFQFGSDNFIFMEPVAQDIIIFSNGEKSFYTSQDFQNVNLKPLKYHENIEKYQKEIEETEEEVKDVQIYCCSKTSEKFFGGTCNERGTIFRCVDDGLCFLSSEDGQHGPWEPKTDENGNPIRVGYYLKRLNISEDSKITSIDYNPNTRRISYANENRVYVCDVKQDFSVKNKKEIHQIDDGDEVVSIKFLQDDKNTKKHELIVFTKNKILYYSSKSTILKNRNIKQTETLSKIGFELKGNHYYCLEDGIYDFKTGEKIYSEESHDFKLYYQGDDIIVLKDDKGLYSFDGQEIKFLYKPNVNLDEIQSVFCIGSNLVGYIRTDSECSYIGYNRLQGVFSPDNCIESNLSDDIENGYTIEKIITRNLEGHPYLCFSRLSSSQEGYENRGLGLITLTNNDTEYEKESEEYTSVKVKDIDTLDDSFKKLYKVGSYNYLIYTNSKSQVIFENQQTGESFNIDGTECQCFTSYENAGYMFGTNYVFIIENLGQGNYEYSKIELPYRTENPNIIYAAVIPEYSKSTVECYISIVYSDCTKLLYIKDNQARIEDALDGLSIKSESDIFVSGLKLFQIDTDDNLSSYEIGKQTEKIDINSEISNIYNQKTIKDISYPGYEEKENNNYKVTTYVNTDKAYCIQSEIEINDELVISSLLVTETPYKYAHIETANANVGLFISGENDVYLKYSRFNSTDEFIEINDGSIINDYNINKLQEKYIEYPDWLNTSEDETITSKSIGNYQWCKFIGYRRNTSDIPFNPPPEGELSVGTIADDVYIAYGNVNDAYISKISFKTRFDIIYNTEPIEGEETPVISSITCKFRDVIVEEMHSENIHPSQIMEFTNGSKCYTANEINIGIVKCSEQSISSFIVQEAEDKIEITQNNSITLQDETIKGVSKYNDEDILVLTDNSLYQLNSKSLVIKNKDILKKNTDVVKPYNGVFALPQFEYEKPTQKIGEEYVLYVKDVGNYTVFLTDDNHYEQILESEDGYSHYSGFSALLPSECPQQMTKKSCSRIKNVGKDTVVFIDDFANTQLYVTAIKDQYNNISFINKEDNSIGEISDIVTVGDGLYLETKDDAVELIFNYPFCVRKKDGWYVYKESDSEQDNIIKHIRINGSDKSTSLNIIGSTSDYYSIFISEKTLYQVIYPKINSLEKQTISLFDALDKTDEEIQLMLSETPYDIFIDIKKENITVVYYNSNNYLNALQINAYTQNITNIIKDGVYDDIKVPNGIVNSDPEQFFMTFVKNSDGTMTIGILDRYGISNTSNMSEFNIDTQIECLTYNTDSTNMSYYLSFGDGNINRVMEFSGLGKNIQYLQESREYGYYDTNFGDGVDIERINKDNFILVFKNQMINYTFEIIDNEVLDWEYNMISADTQFGKISRFNTNTTNKYIIGDGNQIKSSDDTIVWDNKYTVGQNNGNISDIFVRSERDIMCLKGYNIWYSKYQYYLENNTPKFTQTSALNIFNKMYPHMENVIDSNMNTHCAVYHGGSTTLDYINGFVSTKPVFPDDFTSKKIERTEEFGIDNIDISGDYIEKILIGDSDDVIKVGIKNTANGNTSQDSKYKNIQDVSYIAKCWNSGIVDLYIHIPTTYTYYIPHIDYAGYCNVPDKEVKVNGKKLSACLENNYTTINVSIISTYFTIDCILENTIKGMSLPLKIYKGTEYQDEEGYASTLFHSFMEPSISQFERAELLYNEYDEYALKYYCFGTDEQSIRLRFYDGNKNYNKKYKTIIYHGREGETKYGYDTIKQRILEGEQDKQIFGNDVFSSSKGIFVGWTTNKKEMFNANFNKTTISYDDSDVKFTDGKLNLYAVWMHYTFDEKDTIIEVNSENNQTYTIAEIEITPNMNIGGVEMKNQLFVDWDSDTKA